MKLFGSLVAIEKLEVSAAGGDPGTNVLGDVGEVGQAGRFLLGSNLVTPLGDATGGEAIGNWQLETQDPELFAGLRALNPFMASGETPFLSDLADGGASPYGLVAPYGLIDAGLFNEPVATALFGAPDEHAPLFAYAPDNARAALVRVDVGPAGFGFGGDFLGYDLVLLVNLTDQAVSRPQLQAGRLADLTPLKTYVPASLSQPASQQDMDELPGLAVYATLVPEDTRFLAIAESADGIDLYASTDELADGQVLYMAPPALLATVDQSLAPSGTEKGGHSWQRLGVVNVETQEAEVEVSITHATPGILAADGIRLRQVDKAVLSKLELLRLDGNPLGNRAHEFFLPDVPDVPEVPEARLVVINTDDTDDYDPTITGDDEYPDLFYGTPFDSVSANGVTTFYVHGDLHIGPDQIRVEGSNAVSIVVGNDILIDAGAVFDVSAVGEQPGPGGGSAAAGGLGGEGGEGGDGGDPGENGGSGGNKGAGGLWSGSSGHAGDPGGDGVAGKEGAAGQTGADGAAGQGDALNNPDGYGTGGLGGSGGTGGEPGDVAEGGAGGAGGASRRCQWPRRFVRAGVARSVWFYRQVGG